MRKRGLRLHSSGSHVMLNGKAVWIPSAMQVERSNQLVAMQDAGWISDLALEVPFKLIVNGVKISTYKMDAVYRRHTGELVYEETKGFEQPEWKRQARLFTALIGHIHVVKIKKERPEYDEHGKRRRKPAAPGRLGAAISSGVEAIRQEWAWRLPNVVDLFEL